MSLAIDVDHAVEMRIGQPQRIIAGIEEFDLGAEHRGGALGLVLAAGLDLSSVAPASFQANWLSPRSPKLMQTIFMR